MKQIAMSSPPKASRWFAEKILSTPLASTAAAWLRVTGATGVRGQTNVWPRSTAAVEAIRASGNASARLPSAALSPKENKVYFTIKKSPTGQYFARAVGDNNEILANTELYTTKASAENAVRVIRQGAASARVVDNT